EGHMEYDVNLCESFLTGTFSPPVVHFTKTYVNSSPFPIEYEGTVSDDSQSIKGTWHINAGEFSSRGSWRAHRKDDTTKKSQKEKQKKVIERPTETVMSLLALISVLLSPLPAGAADNKT